jgi:WD40 repeat protein
VLSGGWDGHLRLWDSADATPAAALKVGGKPVTACAISPDGTQWLAGTLDGILSCWSADTREQQTEFLAHSRPVSAIDFAVGGRLLATASWDSQVILWDATLDREGRALKGHTDIVSGCRFTPDGQALVSWSHDGTVRLWEAAAPRPAAAWNGHTDRVVAGAVAPDGTWAATAGRDGILKLWDLRERADAGTFMMAAEVRACFFLLDGKSLATVDAAGKLRLHSLPKLEVTAEAATGRQVQCAALAPSGGQFALGSADGRVHFVPVDGFDNMSLAVTATRSSRRTATRVQRWLGKSRLVHFLLCTCPACRHLFEIPAAEPSPQTVCPNCRRALWVSTVVCV